MKVLQERQSQSPPHARNVYGARKFFLGFAVQASRLASRSSRAGCQQEQLILVALHLEGRKTSALTSPVCVNSDRI